MKEWLTQLLANVSGPSAYGAVFGILFVCGLGVPIPEDLSLILGGYLAHQNKADLWGMILTGLAGIGVGDSVIYLMGRNSRRSPPKPGGLVDRFMPSSKRQQVEQLFDKHGGKAVLIARFIPGVRALTFFTAGSAGMPFWRFLAFDMTAALASAPLWVCVGYVFGGVLDQALVYAKRLQFGILGLIAVALAIYFWNARRKRTQPSSPPSQG